MRQSLGTAVFFGMLGVTFFGLLLTPIFYVVIRGFASDTIEDKPAAKKASPPLEEAAPATSGGHRPPVTCASPNFIYTGPSFMAESSDTKDMKEFQLHEKDTGSADVQVALLTRRIAQLTEHLKSHAKDHSSRRGLLKMVATRRSLLDYLSRSKNDRYKSVIEKLNLRK